MSWTVVLNKKFFKYNSIADCSTEPYHWLLRTIACIPRWFQPVCQIGPTRWLRFSYCFPTSPNGRLDLSSFDYLPRITANSEARAPQTCTGTWFNLFIPFRFNSSFIFDMQPKIYHTCMVPYKSYWTQAICLGLTKTDFRWFFRSIKHISRYNGIPRITLLGATMNRSFVSGDSFTSKILSAALFPTK